ncbi:MAG: hypothetical protein FJW39_23780 [Acidobacteria bacterium]|nr:hypothetical protein [Acidobacteriota bacterium]
MHYEAAERRLLRRLSTPEKIQEFLDREVAYNKEPDGITCRSPRRVMRDRVGHCVEGALLAAAALEFHGHPPLIVDLEAVRDDDHVLAVFRVDGLWGAVAKSNYSGLRYRTPVYRTIRELVMSYFEHYYNPGGEKTLRGFSRPVGLGRFEKIRWRTSEDDVWDIPTYLVDVPHQAVIPDRQARKKMRMDKRLYDAGMVGMLK